MKKWLAGLAFAAISLNLPVWAADAEKLLEREHRGVSLIALPADPDKTFDTSLLSAEQGLRNIAKALDRLLAKSPLSARKIDQLKDKGRVLLVYLPDDLMSVDGSENVAAFHPDYFRQNSQQERKKRFLVLIGRHGVKWPRDELAATIAHELVGHGVQHQRGRLAKVRPLDAECEAYLYEEIANQDLGLDKRTSEMVGFRRMLEERWCADFKAYQRDHQPKSLKLWNVLNPDVSKLLQHFEAYLAHAKRAGITAKAMDALKRHVTSDRRRALRGATAEHLYQTAMKLRDGGVDTLPDTSEAFYYFHAAAEQGHIKAWINVAHMYEKGAGVARDTGAALRWYRKAAEAGHLEAQYQLARYFYYGIGVDKDLKAAAHWIMETASNGHAASQNSLGWMYTNGAGVEKAAEKAAAWFQKSAEKGNVQAQLRLGIIYENGLGVPVDSATAYKWYARAAENTRARKKSRETARLSRDRLLKRLAPNGIAKAIQTVE